MQSPKYLNPTISTTLHEFTNHEQDLIRQAFNPVNYTYMSKLPHKISPSQVSRSIKNTTLERLNYRHSSVPKKPTAEFPWLPDSYDLTKLARNKDMQESLEKQRKISPGIFKNPGNQKKLKYEELCGDKFMYSLDNFNAVSEQASRIKWIQSSQCVSKEFKSPQKNDYKVGKNRIREVIRIIDRNIEKNWKGLQFFIEVSAQELIEVRFAMSSVENRKALHSYMNVLQETDMYIQEFLLKKVMDKWGVVAEGWLCYSLAPPWVHMRTSNPSIGLFPHSFSISTSRTGKNVPGSLKSDLFGLTSNS